MHIWEYKYQRQSREKREPHFFCSPKICKKITPVLLATFWGASSPDSFRRIASALLSDSRMWLKGEPARRLLSF